MNFRPYMNSKFRIALFALMICVTSGVSADEAAEKVNDRSFFEEYELLEKQYHKKRVASNATRTANHADSKPFRALSKSDALPGFAKTSDRLAVAYDVHFYLLSSEDASFLEKGSLLGSLRHGVLTDEQCDGLLHFIQTDQFQESGKESSQFLSLKNDALECLLELSELPVGLTAAMIRMVRDESKDPIWREYVLQHFVMLYRAKWPADSPQDTKKGQRERRAIQRALAASIFHCDSGLAGTALIVVEDLSRDYPEFENVLSRSAKMIARDEKACMSSRTTALSMIEGSAEPETIALAGELASNQQHPLAIRIAATGRLREWSHASAQAHAELQKVKSVQNGGRKARMLQAVAEERIFNGRPAK